MMKPIRATVPIRATFCRFILSLLAPQNAGLNVIVKDTISIAHFMVFCQYLKTAILAVFVKWPFVDKINLISDILTLMTRIKKQELMIFLIIVGVASFFRLYQTDISRTFSAILGILTVIGLYLLVRELFEWRIAAIASYLMAISFWHVNFSRMESVAIIIPFILVYSFYSLWKGLKHGHLPYFFMAGIFGGLACLLAGKDFVPTYFIFLAPSIIIVLFINYWWYLKKDFGHEKYEYAKNKLLQGFAILALTTFVVALPVIISFWQNQEGFLSPIKISFESIVKTLGMFNFSGDPLLAWPIGVFFVVGFINELIHWLKRKHGHFSTVHTFMFAWFFVMLIPGFLSTDAPNALLTIGALPIVMIFTARGIWWFFDKLNMWYKLNDPHSKHLLAQAHRAHAITALVMIVFLFSIGFMEYWRYFK